MAQIETWLKCDLKKPVKVQYLHGNLFSQDNQANLIGVELYDNGTAVTASGTVTANIIREDGATVTATGSVSGNKASVVLPATAYAIPGAIAIVIKIALSGVITTIGAVVGTVYRSNTDTPVDPGTIMPSIQTLISQIQTAVASIPADYSSLWTSLAPAFSASTNYAAGQHVTNNGKVYRFNIAHTAGAWVASEVTEIKLGDEIYDLNSALDENLYPLVEKHTFQFPTTKIQVFPFEFVPGEKYTFKNTSSSGIAVGARTQESADSASETERITTGNIGAGVSVDFTVTQSAHYLWIYISGAGSCEIVQRGLIIETLQNDVAENRDEIKNAEYNTDVQLDDLRETNRITNIESVTVSGTGYYVSKTITIHASAGHYFGRIQSATGGTPGNFLAYLSAYDGNNTRLARQKFSTTYPSTAELYAPTGTVELQVQLFATAETSETATVTFSGIQVLQDSATPRVKLNENVEIESVNNLEKALYGISVENTKSFTGTGQSTLDVQISVESGKTYIIELENNNIVGGVQVYGYNGSYTSLKWLVLANTNRFSFTAEDDYSLIRFHYSLSSVGTSPSSKTTIELKPIYESDNNNIIHVGNGFEYTDIQAAIDACPDTSTSPYIIFIHNGEYSEFSTYDNDQRVRYISFIGESRCGVVVRGNKGTYDKPTAEIASFGAVRNMTFIQQTSSETQEEEGRFPYCYALHDDYFQADTEYENCTFISNAGPAVGMGLKANKSKSFRNCTFINNGDGSFGSITLGAFFGHSEVQNDSHNQELVIENCTAINDNGANGLYLSLITTVTGATFKGVNIRNVGSFGNGQASAYCTLPLSYSYGNNVEALNVI